MSLDIPSYLKERKKVIDERLKDYFTPSEREDTTLWESMRYGLMAGGKRLRPILCMASCEAVCNEYEKSIPVACAIEMIHTYSLIHDDLPSMDDDALRRGKPTNHAKYGEAVAILTGDALLTDAFRIITTEGYPCGLTDVQMIEIIRELSTSAGGGGMVLGQAIDLELEGRAHVDIETLQNMHTLKTGALIEASVVSGGIIGSANRTQISQLRSYARSIGLAYQIIDDVLDVEGGRSLGKQKGSDSRKSKATYTSVLGLKTAKETAIELTSDAVRSLNDFDGNTGTLRELAYYLGKREY